jgi:hypothetical protein
MGKDRENPAALAGAHRVHVTVLAGNDDFLLGSPSALDLQVRHILKGFVLSPPVALVIAEHAFQAGGSR